MSRLTEIPIELLVSKPELTRSGRATAFEERLRASIVEMGLAEPLKVASDSSGQYIVIDGALRLNALRAIHAEDYERFATVPAYLLDYERRFEIRYQSDVYQDLLPSQLASLVEHLHESEHVQKSDIARYIGVSPATLRNYTGLWRLLQRGGLFADIVRLMDVGVLPASNPYAWLRLTSDGLYEALITFFTDDTEPSEWIDEAVAAVRNGHGPRFTTGMVEDSTGALPPDRYREGSEVRAVKRNLGLRRTAATHKPSQSRTTRARGHVKRVAAECSDEVIRIAAESLLEFLQ